MKKVVFKKDNRDQLVLLPQELGSLIPECHLVRVVDKVIDDIKISPLIETYKGGGTSSYSPRVMLKILVYAYIERIYTSRRIEKAIRDNICFMWISGMSRPNHATINNFRSKRLKRAIEDVFSSVVEILIERGYVKAENLFIDGTKIEANANRYSYIWKKNVERYSYSVRNKVKELMHHIEKLQKDEDAEYGDHNLEELEGNVSSEDIERAVEEINQKLSQGSNSKKIRSDIKKIKDDYIPRLKKYEDQKGKLEGRNSCSKTDPDATFFRMKEDHVGTGQLKPAYNVQIATENQFILGYGIYQKAADTSVFIQFLERAKEQMQCSPDNVITDAGYGSEENYEYITNVGVGNYVKYNDFDLEHTIQHSNDKYQSGKFVYQPLTDSYRCPEGKSLSYKETQSFTTDNGYKTERRVYQATECSNCSKRQYCCKGKGNRTIQISEKLMSYRKTAKENLESEKGVRLRSQRGVDVESVFGQIKHNRQFRRFHTKGLRNVNTEWAIISIAHNIKKMAN